MISPKNKLTLSDIFSGLIKEEILDVNSMLRDRLSQINIEAAGRFRKGTTVSYTAKRGMPVSGVITKVNKATVKVKTSAGVTWTVSPSLLKAA